MRLPFFRDNRWGPFRERGCCPLPPPSSHSDAPRGRLKGQSPSYLRFGHLSLSLSFAFSRRPRTIPQNPIEIVGQRFRDRFNTSFSIFLFSPPGFFLSLGRTVNFTSVTFYDRAKPTVKLITRIRRVLYGIERTSGTIKRNRLVFSMNGPRGIEKSLDPPGLIMPRNRIRIYPVDILLRNGSCWSPLINRPGESV